MADARTWAAALNDQLEAGIDPREARRAREAEEQARRERASMTVAKEHQRYMVAVREGRSSRAKTPNSPRTIKDKEAIYKRDIEPKLGKRNNYDAPDADLNKLVEAKGKKEKGRREALGAGVEASM